MSRLNIRQKPTAEPVQPPEDPEVTKQRALSERRKALEARADNIHRQLGALHKELDGIAAQLLQIDAEQDVDDLHGLRALAHLTTLRSVLLALEGREGQGLGDAAYLRAMFEADVSHNFVPPDRRHMLANLPRSQTP